MSQVKVSANPKGATSPDEQRCHAPIPKINKIPTICSVPPEQGNTTLRLATPEFKVRWGAHAAALHTANEKNRITKERVGTGFWLH